MMDNTLVVTKNSSIENCIPPHRLRPGEIENGGKG